MQNTVSLHRQEIKTNDERLQWVEALADDLKQLLENNNTAFDDEMIGRQIELVERWIDCYCHNLVAAETFSEASAELLADLRMRLKLAAEELQRLEGEGGNPATEEQMAANEETLKAIRRSEKLLSHIETLFSPKCDESIM